MSARTKSEKPIPFSGPMARAILEGRKSQTRRVVRGIDQQCNALIQTSPGVWQMHFGPDGKGLIEECNLRAPYAVGDTLWVREGWRTGNGLDKNSGSNIAKLNYESGYRGDGPKCPIWYEADGLFRQWGDNDIVDFGEKGRYRHARFMPRWASRITLEVTGVRVQRVQEISEQDARAEGMESITPYDQYRALWDSLNAKSGYSWASDPWVWAYTFRVLEVRR